MAIIDLLFDSYCPSSVFAVTSPSQFPPKKPKELHLSSSPELQMASLIVRDGDEWHLAEALEKCAHVRAVQRTMQSCDGAVCEWLHHGQLLGGVKVLEWEIQ